MKNPPPFSSKPDENPATVSVTAQDIDAGQRVYSRTLLIFYDALVLKFFNRFIWGCPSPHIHAMYQRHISDNHLEVGVGTGAYLESCRFPSENPRLALMDMNPNCLETASRRLARYRPEIYRRNIYEPIVLNGGPFDSIGLNYVLHCLPGNLRTKAVVLTHLKKLLKPGGVVFGATLLGSGPNHRMAKLATRIFNEQKIFSNADDHLRDLKGILTDGFEQSEVILIGSAALFWARNK